MSQMVQVGGLTKNSAFKLWYENNVELSTKTEEANQKYTQMKNKEDILRRKKESAIQVL